MIHTSPRGFTLLIAVILTSVLLSVGLSLIDTAYKQLLLSSTAKQSEMAFYIADSALECALYHDQRLGSFSFTTPAANISCNGQTAPITLVSLTGTVRTSSVTFPCITGGGTSQGSITVYKNISGATAIYANGLSSCIATDPRRVERGLKITY